MAKQRESTIEITIRLTPHQIRQAYRQLIEKETGKDWLEDPEILEMLTKREAKIAKEMKKGQFVTLEQFQSKLRQD